MKAIRPLVFVILALALGGCTPFPRGYDVESEPPSGSRVWRDRCETCGHMRREHGQSACCTVGCFCDAFVWDGTQ